MDINGIQAYSTRLSFNWVGSLGAELVEGGIELKALLPPCGFLGHHRRIASRVVLGKLALRTKSVVHITKECAGRVLCERNTHFPGLNGGVGVGDSGRGDEDKAPGGELNDQLGLHEHEMPSLGVVVPA